MRAICRAKKYILTLVCCIATTTIVAQVDAKWTDDEVRAANTAATCSYMNKIERDVVLYNNLARLYPRKFARVEVAKEPTTSYVSSLIRDLNNMQPVGALTINEREAQAAKCWAEVSGRYGIVGHDRVECESYYIGGWGAENCSYGMHTGRAIIMQLLIDEGQSGLGHRQNCLNGQYSSVGVGVAEHSRYGICCVEDFTSYSGLAYYMAPGATYREQTPTHQADYATEYSQPSRVQKLTPNETSQQIVETEPVEITSPRVQSTPAPAPAPTPAPEPEPEIESAPVKKRATTFSRFYDYSGYNTLRYLTLGYTYSFVDHRHLLDMSLMDFRLACVGLSLLNAELSVSPFDKRVAYKPSLRIYLPVAKCFAFVPYGGVAVDASYLGQYLVKNYDYDKDRDFYLSAVAGLALHLSAAQYVPMDIKVEYRYPIIRPTGTAMHSQGVYLGAQLYFGSIYKKKN